MAFDLKPEGPSLMAWWAYGTQLEILIYLVNKLATNCKYSSVAVAGVHLRYKFFSLKQNYIFQKILRALRICDMISHLIYETLDFQYVPYLSRLENIVKG